MKRLQQPTSVILQRELCAKKKQRTEEEKWENKTIVSQKFLTHSANLHPCKTNLSCRPVAGNGIMSSAHLIDDSIFAVI